MNALERGGVVGTNGSANVYRITYNGVEKISLLVLAQTDSWFEPIRSAIGSH